MSQKKLKKLCRGHYFYKGYSIVLNTKTKTWVVRDKTNNPSKTFFEAPTRHQAMEWLDG